MEEPIKPRIQRTRQQIEEDAKAIKNNTAGFKLLAEILLDIRENTQKPELSKEAVMGRLKEMKEISESLGQMAGLANVMNAQKGKGGKI